MRCFVWLSRLGHDSDGDVQVFSVLGFTSSRLPFPVDLRPRVGSVLSLPTSCVVIQYCYSKQPSVSSLHFSFHKNKRHNRTRFLSTSCESPSSVALCNRFSLSLPVSLCLSLYHSLCVLRFSLCTFQRSPRKRGKSFIK